MVSLLVAMPAIALGMFNAFAGGDHHGRPEFVAYEHLRLRTKVILLLLSCVYVLPLSEFSGSTGPLSLRKWLYYIALTVIPGIWLHIPS